MSKASRPARARARAGRGALALVAAILAVVVLGTAGASADDGDRGDDGGLLHAGITTFTMSPRSGPPGTLVHVSGSGCAPGLLSSPSTDFVTVAASALDLAFQAPVASNGSWQGSFTVPADPLSLPSVVVALCTSAGLPSLFTIYSPMTFTVSLPIVPPTVPVPPTTLPVPRSPLPVTLPATTIAPGPTTTSSAPQPNGGSGAPLPRRRPPASTPTTVGGTPGPISIDIPGDTGLPAVGGSPGRAPTMRGGSTGARPGSRTVSAIRSKPTARSAAAPLPADLGPASLAAHSAGGSGGLGWLAWALLALVVAAAIGAPALLWSRRQANVASPEGEST